MGATENRLNFIAKKIIYFLAKKFGELKNFSYLCIVNDEDKTSRSSGMRATRCSWFKTESNTMKNFE